MTRYCGLCRGEVLLREYLVGLVPGSVVDVERHIPDDRTCGACGGKLLA